MESRLVALTQRFAGAAAGGGLLGGFVGGIAGVGAVGAITAIEAPLRMVATGIRDIIDLTASAVGTAIQLSMEWEKSAIAFEVMTKNADRGRKLLGDLQQLAIETPYRSSQMVHFGEMLLGYGVKPDDVIPSLARLGDIAGGNVDKFRRLALAFGQVLTAGRFMGQEKRQFAEAGVGLEDFAETAGMTSRQFVDAMERGEIGADVMVRTINRLTNEGGRFHGLMQRINLETVGGQFDALMERLERFGRIAFAGDPGRGIRGLFERFNVSGFIGDLSGRLDAFDPSSYLDRFENWARRGLTSLSPLEQTFDILVQRTEQWANASQGLIPTWEQVSRFIQDINTEHLPKFLDWIERQAAAVRQLGAELQAVGEFWRKLDEHLAKGQNGGNVRTGLTPDFNRLMPPGYENSPAKLMGDAARLLGMLGPEEKRAAQFRSMGGDRIEEEQKAFEALHFARIREMRAQADARRLNAPVTGALIGGLGVTGPMSEFEIRDQMFARQMRLISDTQGRALGAGGLLGAALPIGAGVSVPHGVSPNALGALVGGYAARGAGPTSILPAAEIAGDTWPPFNATRYQRNLMRQLGNYQGLDLGAMGEFQRKGNALQGLYENLGGFGGWRPQITQEQYHRGMFEAYRDLEKSFGKASQVQLAPAALAGSQSAQEAINTAMVQQANATERMHGVMDAARIAAEALLEHQRTIIGPLLEQIRDQSGVIVGEDE